MSADLLSNFIGMTLQATGNNNNAWGTILNGSALQPLERAIRGNIVRAVTGGTLDLSGSPPPAALTQVLDFVQIFQGALTVNQIVILPNLSGYWKFVNETTGAFQLLLQTPGGTFVNIPQGCSRGITCDGAGNLLRDDRDQIGNFEHNSVVKPGTLQCSGQSLLQASYPDLFATIGTTFGSVDSLHFTLPLLTDTGRFLRSTTSTLTVGTAQSNQNKNHTHTGSGTTATESVGHTHAGSGTTGTMSANASHSHFGEFTFDGSGGAAAIAIVSGSWGLPQHTGITNTDHTHSYSFTTGSESANHTHTYSFTTSTGSADGTEARPEATWPLSSASGTENAKRARRPIGAAQPESSSSALLRRGRRAYSPPNSNQKTARRHDSLAGSACAPGFRSISNMNAYQNFPKSAIDLQPSTLPPWPFVVVRPNTVAGQFVARRFRVDPALADLVADLAGIGSEVRS